MIVGVWKREVVIAVSKLGRRGQARVGRSTVRENCLQRNILRFSSHTPPYARVAGSQHHRQGQLHILIMALIVTGLGPWFCLCDGQGGLGMHDHPGLPANREQHNAGRMMTAASLASPISSLTHSLTCTRMYHRN